MDGNILNRVFLCYGRGVLVWVLAVYWLHESVKMYMAVDLVAFINRWVKADILYYTVYIYSVCYAYQYLYIMLILSQVFILILNRCFIIIVTVLSLSMFVIPTLLETPVLMIYKQNH